MTDYLQQLKAALSDRYVIESKAGVGGMATVYRARDLRHDRTVALKVLKPEIAAAMGAERFLNEIRVTANLQHPHILPLYDSGDVGGVLYYVMPFVEGESLRDRLNREIQLSIDDAVHITQQVATALAYAHRQDVVHRDIKPENILLHEGEAIVADFGIALAVDHAGGDRLTASGLAVGTPKYMSPEQASHVDRIDGRTDVYALGCVLYEMLAGEPPHTGPTPQAILAKRMATAAPPVETLRDTVPTPIANLIATALARVPADRCSATEFAAQLGQSLETGGAAPQLPGLRAPPTSRAKTLRRVAAGAGVLVVAVLAVIFGVPQRTQSGTSEPSAARAAVFPFLYHGSDEHSHLGGGLVGLLSTVLDGVGDLRTVDPGAVLGLVEREETGTLTPTRARELARQLGAGRYVMGRIQEAGGQVTITASAYDATSDGEIALDSRTVQGDVTDQLFRLVNDLTVQLLGTLGISESPRRLQSMSTASVVALNEYLRGEMALRRGEYDSAATKFNAAIAADSLFALAWYRLSRTLNTTGVSQLEPARRAVELGDRLSERDGRLAEANLAFLEVDATKADRLYRALLNDYADDVEALFGLADVQFHWGPLVGLSMSETPQGFERVLFFEPHHAEALWHHPWAAALNGDVAGVESGVARLVAEGALAFVPLYNTYLAFAKGDVEAQEQAIDAMRSLDDVTRYFTVNLLSTLPRLGPARRITEELFTDPSRLPVVQSFGHVLAAHLALAEGQLQPARERIALAEAIDSATGLEYRALLALTPYASAGPEDLEALRSDLRAWNAASVPSGTAGNPWFTPHDGLHEHLRLYLLGVLSARLDDGESGRRYAADLEQLDPALDPQIGAAFAHRVRAHVALAEGHPADALMELDKSGPQGMWERAYASPFFSQSYERYLRASALEALDRTDEALRWYSSVWMQQSLDVSYRAPSHFRRAEIYERLGKLDSARVHYATFLDLWTEADSDVQRTVAEAQQRLRSLAAEAKFP